MSGQSRGSMLMSTKFDEVWIEAELVFDPDNIPWDNTVMWMKCPIKFHDFFKFPGAKEVHEMRYNLEQGQADVMLDSLREMIEHYKGRLASDSPRAEREAAYHDFIARMSALGIDGVQRSRYGTNDAGPM